MSWFSRTSVKPIFAALQDAITRTAVGAARTSQRLGSVGSQIRRTNEVLGEMVERAGGLNGDIQRVAEAARHTREASGTMIKVAGEGKALSEASEGTTRELQAQMGVTIERIDRLMESVNAIMAVSGVIDAIAQQTRLLSVNASIEAARAGEHGRGFGVVAHEVGTLADNTARRTQEIKALLNKVTEDLGPTRQAVEKSGALVEDAAARAHSLGAAMGRINKLADDIATHMNAISSSVEQQREGIGDVFDKLRAATDSARTITKDAEAMTQATFALSELTEETFDHFASVDTDSTFHRVLGLARNLAKRSETIFDQAIDSGRCTLSDVLALEYREIKGDDIGSLAHLFNVSRVPRSGFTPPKYHTRYDRVVDGDLMEAMDDIKSREPGLIFALVIDLNAYGPIHNRDYCKDWTGDPDKDLVGNRIKRFFTDQRVLVRGARVGLPGGASLPERASRDDFVRTGAQLGDASSAARNRFLVQTYARDTGAIVTALTVPLFASGERWGAVLMGWNTDGAR